MGFGWEAGGIPAARCGFVERWPQQMVASTPLIQRRSVDGRAPGGRAAYGCRRFTLRETTGQATGRLTCRSPRSASSPTIRACRASLMMNFRRHTA